LVLGEATGALRKDGTAKSKNGAVRRGRTHRSESSRIDEGGDPAREMARLGYRKRCRPGTVPVGYEDVTEIAPVEVMLGRLKLYVWPMITSTLALSAGLNSWSFLSTLRD